MRGWTRGATIGGALGVATAVLVAAAAFAAGVEEQGEATVVLVTNPGDTEIAEAACPSESLCTLRAAITFVNADATEGAFRIEIDAGSFPGGSVVINIGLEPLPEVGHPDVTVSGEGLDVAIRGGEGNGLRLAGPNNVVEQLEISGFTGNCLELTGNGSRAMAVEVGGCGVGIAALGADVEIDDSTIGVVGGEAAPNGTGILVTGTGARIGATAGNVVGNAGTAVRVNGPESVVTGNTIGIEGETAAPVDTAVRIESGAVTIGPGNTIANTSTAIVAGLTADPATLEAIVVQGNTIGAESGAPGVATGVSLGPGSVAPTVRTNVVRITGAGVRIEATGAILEGNTIEGTGASGGAIGVDIRASGAVVGGLAGPSLVNRFRDLSTAITIGDGSAAGTPVEGVVVLGNQFGEEAARTIGAGIRIRRPALGSRIEDNAFAGIDGSAVAIGDSVDDGTVRLHTIAANTYANLGGLAIDLGSDSIRNANDETDSDAGPNDLLNNAVITSATVAAIEGDAGPACTGDAGCAVEVYLGLRQPGSSTTTPSSPLATVPVDGAGRFRFTSLGVVAGDRVMATVIDGVGNTSEFGPSVRVGTGSATCGPVDLGVGWNLEGYFGALPVSLGLTLPASGGGPAISAVHQLQDGSLAYDSWFRGTVTGRTLSQLDPLEAYWYFADEPATLPDSFAITFPVAVDLVEGWNAFVYIGAEASAEDAFGSILAQFDVAYRYINENGAERWERVAGGGLAPWLTSVESVEPCAAYLVRMREPGRLTPPQP